MAAPLGNKFAVGADSGRPAKFASAQELENAIQEYFDTGVKVRKVEVGKGADKTVAEIPVPTITGLCIYCGFCSRQSLYDYEKREEFSYIVRRARLFIENEYEEMLHHGNTMGAIFALKNMAWKDTSRTELTGADGGSVKTDNEFKVTYYHTHDKPESTG